LGQRPVGTIRPRVLGGLRIDGFTAEFFDAFADRREIVGGAGWGHIISVKRAETRTVRAG
jgi:hypothetical protein